MPLIDDLRSHLSDRFSIERELGRGGMAVVFLAVERALDRRVVIKVLAPELGQTVNAERFNREISTLATLQHPQIVPIYSAGQAGSLLYYVMPYVAGESLGARLARDGALPPDEVVRLLTPLARALAYAHREGVVHRDIKPDNILLAQGEPVLADFGIAKVLRDGSSHGALTSTGMSMGTAAYMAPEQVVADPDVDGRADVYSLAAVGYELLVGVPPFTGTPQQIMSAHVVHEPPDLAATAPATPPKLRAAISLGLKKQTTDRPDASAFAALLEGSANPPAVTEAVSVNAASGWRRGPTVAAVAVLLVVALAGAAWWWAPRSRDTAPAGSAVDAPAVRPGVAVLPFERIGDEDDAYLAAGLTEELMVQLGEVPELRVASRTTVRAYSDSALPPAELGSRLNVRALVEGSVQRNGNQLRVSTRLVDVSDGNTLWAQRYDRLATDLFAVQREIGAAVVAALTPRLGLSQGGRGARGTSDADAYDLFLRGRFALDQRGADSLRAAVALFTRATERDPQFARAHAGIAEAAALLPQYGGGTYASQRALVLSAADRALALDSLLAAPHMARALWPRGWVSGRRRRMSSGRRWRASATLRRRTRIWGSCTTRWVGSMRRRALWATRPYPGPTNSAIVGEYAFALLLSGNVDSARTVIDAVLSRDDGIGFLHFTRALVLERQGDPAGALQSMTEAYARTPLPLFVGGRIRLARTLAARETAGRDVERAARAQLAAMRNDPGFALASAVADVGAVEPGMTIDLLARAVAAEDPIVVLIPLRLWWFDPLRGSPAFVQVATSLGLPSSATDALGPPRR